MEPITISDGTRDTDLRPPDPGSATDQEEEEEDLDLTDEDFITGIRGGISAIQFSERAYKLMEASMARTAVLKLLGKNIGLHALSNKTFAIWKPRGAMDHLWALLAAQPGFQIAVAIAFSIISDFNTSANEAEGNGQPHNSPYAPWMMVERRRRSLPTGSSNGNKPTPKVGPATQLLMHTLVETIQVTSARVISPMQADHVISPMHDSLSDGLTFTVSKSAMSGMEGSSMGKSLNPVSHKVVSFKDPSTIGQRKSNDHGQNRRNLVSKDRKAPYVIRNKNPTVKTGSGLCASNADKVIGKLGFDHSFKIEAIGISAGIWILWNSSLSVDIIVAHPQYIHATISRSSIPTPFYFPKLMIRKGAPNLLGPNEGFLNVLTGWMKMMPGPQLLQTFLCTTLLALSRITDSFFSRPWTWLLGHLEDLFASWLGGPNIRILISSSRKIGHSMGTSIVCRALIRRKANCIQALRLNNGDWCYDDDTLREEATIFKFVFPKIFEHNQASFIVGRRIKDNILVAQEVIHSMRRKKCKTHWMAIKVDLEKAYDRVAWDFLSDSLKDMGFPTRMHNIIMNSITFSNMQLLWNDSLSADFKPTRGIRQGFPLSPYFFLCMERLGQGIHYAQNFNLWDSMVLSRGGPKIFHLFFADILLLFCKATRNQEFLTRAILDQFSRFSGAQGFQRCFNLGSYLGMPLFHNRITKNTFQFIVDKMVSIPVGICEKIEMIARRFIWGGTSWNPKMTLVKWETCCQPTSHGGLAIEITTLKNPKSLNKPSLHWYDQNTKGNSRVLEVIAIGSKKDAFLEFCLDSPFQSPSLRFW
ncbi:hypothetical protein F3Y22_tig00110912pilonHSYRG00189 [Hibiscus syriacus]|uniref:Reverse transcriptase domain-containing protein n=1 Tax=Hibiscus syriacus TaxID=106335 RepID=A0A6A2ZDT2_HIBSY|nr:hypothetical protein F3Y22_tig00110912pilonHSYRG00189 [Hibiscus syriacus]